MKVVDSVLNRSEETILWELENIFSDNASRLLEILPVRRLPREAPLA